MLNYLNTREGRKATYYTKFFIKKTFNNWIPATFALLSNLEAEFKKEQAIFLKIKKNNKLRGKIDKKIKHIIEEKEKILKIKENRTLSMKKVGKISDDYRESFHDYISIAHL